MQQGVIQQRRTKKGKKGTANSFPHAEKMRSSVSHFYAIDQGRGCRQFMERVDGSWSLVVRLYGTIHEGFETTEGKYRLHTVFDKVVLNVPA